MDCTRFVEMLENVITRPGDQWQACCPAHEDGNPSLSIKKGDDARVLVKCHAGCTPEEVVKSMGLTMADLMPDNGLGDHHHNGHHKRNGHVKKRSTTRGKIVETYDYCDENGDLVFQVVRYEPKDFRQRKPGHNGGWDWSVKGCPTLPYHLPELIAKPNALVFVVEGERDVHSLESIGLTATTNPGGAEKWTAEHAAYLQDHEVVVVPDNDDSGEKHAFKVVNSLPGIAKSVRVVRLGGLPLKGDVSDWIQGRADADPRAIASELISLVIEQPEVEFDTLAKPDGMANLLPDDVREHPGDEDTEPQATAIEPYTPFPVEALPTAVKNYVVAASTAIGCSAAFIALPLLACLARAIGNARVVRLKRTWSEPAIIWAAIVGKSGTHKTPAMHAATLFLQKFQELSIARYEESLEAYDRDKALYDRAYSDWKKQKNSDEPPPWAPAEPVCERYLTTDATIEALADRLAAQFDGLLVVRDELSGWLGGIAEYKGGKGSDLGHWLASWSAAPLTVDRKTGIKKMLHVPRASVSLTGGIQPGVLRGAIGREHMQDGLCARLLLAMPEPKPVTWTDDVIDDEVEADMRAVFEQLIGLEPAADADGNPEPYPLSLTTDAKSVWVRFFNRHRAELADLDDDLAAAWSKLEAYAARFALIHQLCAWAAGESSGDAIDLEAIEAGIVLADWFGGEAKRVYGLFSESPEDQEKRDLVDLIRRKGGRITTRELTHGTSRYRGAGVAQAALDALVKAGSGKWEVVPTVTNQRSEFVLSVAR